jgi:hypothetical protein
MDNIDFIKTDDDYNINITAIVWVKQMDNCMYICNKTTGCKMSATHKICRNVSRLAYDKLDLKFNPTAIKFHLLKESHENRTTNF